MEPMPTYVMLERVEEHEHETKLGIVIADDPKKKMQGDTVVLHKGKVLKVGNEVKDVEVGQTAVYNPFDSWTFEGMTFVPGVHVKAVV